MLIQMVIVMIGISMAMTVVGSILFRLFRHEANVLGTVAETQVTARLASLLREDIHTADRVEVSGEGKTLTIHQDETQIVWSQVSPDELQRVRIPAREQRDPKKIPGERFRLLGVQTQFSISDANGQAENHSTVTLTLSAKPDPANETRTRVNVRPLNTKVVACVGLSR